MLMVFQSYVDGVPVLSLMLMVFQSLVLMVFQSYVDGVHDVYGVPVLCSSYVDGVPVLC